VKPAPNMYSQCQAWENAKDQVVTGFDFIIIIIVIIIFIKLVKLVLPKAITTLTKQLRK